MAVRPSWDLPLSEIQKRADSAKVDAYFARQRAEQARADSTTRATSRPEGLAMTADQVVAYSAALRRGENPDLNAYAARADSAPTRDGMQVIAHIDRTGREILEFRSLTGRKTWMNLFKAPSRLQVVISGDVEWNRTKLQKYLNENPEAKV